ARGTWPASLPQPLASAIDHVLLDPARWSVRGAAVEDVAGSDHRAVVAVLRER
ncbi:MAG: Endonuclease/exonuclease/phosphatase, partial [uncultured Quadrisphaera sp.]